ncbi:glycosyltransferase family 4 protein [soil metagenome]
MKILLIHNRYQQAGGEDAVFHNEGKLLAKNGHCVEELLFDNSVISSWKNFFIIGIQAIYNFTSARTIQQKITNFGPHVIHVHNFTPIVSPSVFFIANRNKIPVVVTLHNYRLLCPSATLFYDKLIYEKSIHSLFPWDAVLKGVYRNSVMQTAALAFVTAFHTIAGTWRNRVDQYITLTSFAKEKFVNSRLAISDEKLVVKPNFIEFKGNGLALREDYFLFVGRLTEEKGIRTLLDAASIEYFKLVIIGDGPLRSLVEDCASIQPNITYVGPKKNDEVLTYLKACRALIFPSIWYEGFPVTILEAFSTSTLVIASKLGGMAEIIQDQENGLLFEAGNPDKLVSTIIELSSNPERAAEIGENGHTSYLERYTPQINYEQLTDVYYKVIARQQNGSGKKMVKELYNG